MARPLREQFALATFLLLVPIGVVMTFASVSSFNSQIDQAREEQEHWARTIARHLETAGDAGIPTLNQFLRGLPLPPGSSANVQTSDGIELGKFDYPPSQGPNQQNPSSEPVAGHPWVANVGLPTSVAWQRAGPDATRTIVISGVATLVLLIVQAAFLRRLLPALSSLERSAERVGAGDLSVPTRIIDLHVSDLAGPDLVRWTDDARADSLSSRGTLAADAARRLDGACAARRIAPD